MKMTIGAAVRLTFVGLVSIVSTAWEGSARSPSTQPIVIGHRGASGYVPEHTLVFLLHRHPAGRRLRRARSGDRPKMVSWSRATKTRSAARPTSREHPEFAARAERPRRSMASASPAGSPRTSRSRSSRRCGSKERIPQMRPDNTRFDGQFESPHVGRSARAGAAVNESGGSPRAGRASAQPDADRHLSRDEASDLLRLARPVAGRAVGAQRCIASDTPASARPLYIQSFEVGNLQAT